MAESVGRCIPASKARTEVPLSGRGRPRLLRTHRKFYALLIVATSSDRLFLSGLLASRARLRFTGTPILIRSGIGHNKITANGQQCLNCLSQPRGPPQIGLASRCTRLSNGTPVITPLL